MKRFSLIALALLAGPGSLVLQARDEEYPKLAPFSAVRWKDATPQVRVNSDTWYELLELNDLKASKIVAFSKKTYDNLWQKRFEEDLVEVLSRMGHKPGDTVKLKLRDLKTEKTQVLDRVPMTKENRRALWKARQDRENN